MHLELSEERTAVRELAAKAALAAPADLRRRARPVSRSPVHGKLDAARLPVWRVADLIDRGRSFRTESSVAKVYVSEGRGQRHDHRAPGLRRARLRDEYAVCTYVRDTRVMALHEGTSQIQQLLTGREPTGVNAF